MKEKDDNLRHVITAKFVITLFALEREMSKILRCARMEENHVHRAAFGG